MTELNVNETVSAVNEMASKGVERMTSLSELNLRVFERLAARQMDTMNMLVEHGARVMKLASEAKGYNELLQAQIAAAKELSEQLMSQSKTNMQLAGEVRDEYRSWLERNMAEVGSELRNAAPGTKSAA